jgi:hypothetical protein
MILRYRKGWTPQRTPAPTCLSGPRSKDGEFATVNAIRLDRRSPPPSTQYEVNRGAGGSKGLRSERIPERLTRA